MQRDIPTSQLKREIVFEKIARARELATVGTHNNFYEWYAHHYKANNMA